MNDNFIDEENEGHIQSNRKKHYNQLLSTCQKVSIGCLSLCGLTIFILSFFIPSFVENMINGKVPDQVILTESNSGLWAKLPGDSQVDLMRVLTVYEPTNLLDVIFRGQKPQFIEHEKVYSLIQVQEFTNRTYSEDGKEVTSNRYVTFQEKNAEEGTKEYSVVNPGLFGSWYLGTHLPQPKLTWMTIGQVMQNLQEQLVLNIYYQGFHYQFVKDEASCNALLKMINDEQKRKDMFYDHFMGLGNPDTMENWVRLGLEGHNFGPAGQLLRDYFDLNQELVNDIRKAVSEQIKAINVSAMANSYNCNPYGQDPDQKKYKYDCDGKYFTALQWQSSGISANPPPGLGILPTDSVNFTNNTLHDYIEIAYYYKGGEFEADYGDQTFDLDWAYQFLNRNYDYPVGGYMKDENLLQHKGNVEFIYEVGAKFDKSKNLEDLKPIQERFQIKSLELAHVVYRWVQQMGVNFSFRRNLGGKLEHGGIGLFASESIYYHFRNVSEYLLPYLLSSEMIFKQKWKDCKTMFKSSIGNIDDKQAESICKSMGYQLNVNHFMTIQQLCTFGVYGAQLQEFGKQHSLTQNQIFEICSEKGSTDQSFQDAFQLVHAELKEKYNCQYTHCSKQEIAIKQFARCEITLNPPPSLTKQKSIHYWNKKQFPRPFEYGYFMTEYKDIFTKEPPQMTDFQAKKLLHFKGIFNPLAITSAFIYEKNHPAFYLKFIDIYQVREYEHITQYLRFAAIQGVMGGLATTRTPKELFFGYSEPLGEELKNNDPAGNGDPSTNSWVMLGDPNMTIDDSYNYPQVLFTGKDNLTMTRYLKSMNRYDYAIYNYSYFDGNKTFTKWENPWNEKEYITSSTDGITFKPFLEKEDMIRLYVPQLYRVLELKSTSSGPKIHGLDTIHFELSMDNLKIDPKYNNQWNGTINMEKPFNAPAVVSLPHFYQSQSNLSDLVTIVNKDGHVITANDYDKIYANIEKYSGAPLQAVIQFMISMKIQKDELFVNVKEDMVLPLITLYNSGNFTEKGVKANFGELKTGLSTINWGWYLVMTVGIIMILGAVLIVVIAKYKKQKVESVISEL
ncbi:unnamed protein product (macronuclear) [Paramecium tetraurelia]|uniref:CD36 family protein n=1 Tax=Paramecium tetraurelia TaxID=5888 RepID=A0BF02_PARTE|nr:uncharacterized protein GSPATT00028154001 [Paramecium tetraurelia]CAK57119.1 unnamed protein product [Paramecium tetraurelia]|eukprot:XP_001424517.1 hypothetical protein (macronuclear) [Paramecium tetraurelia strain d4-2]